ncbi:hypothetical protein [Castellaniella sp. GW247-6E4]|uniref:hypothetical protein n=1 Tax=Castellaniella sp. GW247-6E4 TaxID=3140380 RepID=UPI003315BEF6
MLSMPAARPANGTKRITIWQVFFCLTAIVFLLRALIAPDTLAGHEAHATRSSPTFYDEKSTVASGGASIDLAGLTDRSRHSSQDHPDSQICPFCAVAAQAALPLQPALSVVAATPGYLVFFVSKTPTPRYSPPLGSPVGARAPPLRLA